jgi:isopentenyl-diphosphate Delta-isomerase
MDMLILVDAEDNIAGYDEKENCHLIPTKLHSAFSIFIINSKGKMLIHKRSGLKETWPGFWTNACCSHPRKGESLEHATQRRLMEEIGFTCPLKYLFKFQYQSDYDKKYGENEVDHVFIGFYDGPLKPDKNEIEEYKFIGIDTLLKDVKNHPANYTPWFMKALPGVINHIRQNNGNALRQADRV